ncbi:MAG: PilW family protein [Methylotenera sp.]
MTKNNKKIAFRQTGFSLVEILVGLVIGLLATLVIMQVFSVFDGQKRSTSGNSDAQTNGSIALNNIQRDVQMAGFGLPMPMADKDNAVLKCNPSPAKLFPVLIEEGAAGASDTITIRYSTTALGAIPVKINDPANALSFGLTVENNIGCKDNDVVLIANGTSCVMTTAKDANGAPDTLINITLAPATPVGSPIVIGAKLACMGNWQDYKYEVVNDQLELNGVPSIAEIVNIQAQYGVSASATSNQVNEWVDATGTWAAPTVADRNRIKALRIAVVARNGLLEKTVVTNTCTTTKGTANNGPCAWDDTDYDAAPMIDLSDDANWQRYRYRSFETIIPLRNMLWSKGAL